MSKMQISNGADYAPTAEAEKVVEPGAFMFASAFLDHGHIHGHFGRSSRFGYDPFPRCALSTSGEQDS